jgi:two-component system, sensor histidine kinase
MDNSLLSTGYPLTILIGDDNPASLARTREILNEFGYRPDTATSGKAVLEMVGQKEYDLVLLELHMRDSHKYGAMEVLRARQHAHPLVVGTGLADETKAGIHTACLREGMDHYVAKPLIQKELALQLKACSILTGKRRSDGDLKVA